MLKNTNKRGFVAFGQNPSNKDLSPSPVGALLLDIIQISLQLSLIPGFEQRADRLKNCGLTFNFFTCDCGFKRFPQKCNYRICPECGKTRSFKFYKKFIEVLKDIRIARSIYDEGLRFLTLTIGNSKSLDECINKLFSSITKLKRRRYFKDRVKAGIGVIDIKEGKDGLWNVHAHFIIYSRYLDVKSHLKTGRDSKLVQEWKHCTGGDGILYIERVRSHQGALNYVLKYLTKGISGLRPEQTAFFFKKTFGRRLIFTFGLFYDIKTTKTKSRCKDCGSTYQYLKIGTEEYVLAHLHFNSIPDPPPDPNILTTYFKNGM